MDKLLANLQESLASYQEWPAWEQNAASFFIEAVLDSKGYDDVDSKGVSRSLAIHSDLRDQSSEAT